MIILAVDQASRQSGYSLYDNSQLIAYGDLIVKKADKLSTFERMHMMFNMIEELVDKYRPDCIIAESCQNQNSLRTFNLLSMMQGLTMSIAFKRNLLIDFIPPVTWRSYCGIGKGKRDELKQLAVKKAEELLGLTGQSVDTCEAALIGYYACSIVKEDDGT